MKKQAKIKSMSMHKRIKLYNFYTMFFECVNVFISGKMSTGLYKMENNIYSKQTNNKQ